MSNHNSHFDSEPFAITNWAAIAGVWEFEGAKALYKGPTGDAGLPYGVALSDVQLRDGVVQAKVSFTPEGSTNKLRDTTAGVILGFQSESAEYVMAQLGAYDRAYVISEYTPPVGWTALATAGSIVNLRSDHPYSLLVTQIGQKIKVVVDNVPVFDHVLQRPFPGNQVGLFAWGKTPILFEETMAQRQRPRAFVAMPFMEPFDTLYREVIRREAEELSFEVVRIDEVTGPGIIFEDIKRQIEEAKVVIAEITAPNQNVFYELGYAHALKKPTVLLAQRGKELPLDIRSYRVIFYEDTIGGKPAVEKDLRKHLRAILRDL